MKNGGGVSIVLAGIGGMGGVYLKALLEDSAGGRGRIVGAADPFPERCPDLEAVRELLIPVTPSLESFYANHSADLAIISSPHQFHASQTILALERGSHVLCEKPAAATIQDVRAMREAERRADRWVAVGYQWTFSRAIQDLKADILAGRFGRPRRARCLTLWPREFSYYARNDWAGRLKDPAGRWVLDGPANNAMAHDLHNMFFLFGGEAGASAQPVRVEAELYRAYPIENYDTAAARIMTESGQEMILLVSHVPEVERGPICDFEFEAGVVRIEGRTEPIRARWADGSEKTYGLPDAEPMRKLWLAIEGVRTGRPPLCGLAAAEAQTLCINGLQESATVETFPAALIDEKGEGAVRRLAVKGLDDVLSRCYESWRLPWEKEVPWARRGRAIDLASYRLFPRGRSGDEPRH